MIAESRRIAHDLLLWNTAVVVIRIAGKQFLLEPAGKNIRAANPKPPPRS
jgi:hypothetical protein